MTADSGDERGSDYRGYVTQKAVLFGERDEILLVRSGPERPWSIPGGRIEEEEGADEALVRELREETGLSVDVGPPVGAMTGVWYTDAGEPVFAVVYHCETDETDVALGHEHEAYEWVSFETARERMPVRPLAVAVERAYDRHR